MPQASIITVSHEDQTLAIIIPGNYSKPGISFFTPDDYSQQLAYMAHPAGHCIKAHRHNQNAREVTYTQEVLFIKKGVLRADFFSPAPESTYVGSYELRAGDAAMLCAGGHGFEVVEDMEMIEVKQGPYTGDNDKARLECAPPPEIRMIKG